MMVTQLFCGAYADKDKAVQIDDTALIMASRSGHLKVARLLCVAGADKDKAVRDDTALVMSSIWAPGGGPTALWS